MSKKRAPGEYWGQHPVKNDMQPKKKRADRIYLDVQIL